MITAGKLPFFLLGIGTVFLILTGILYLKVDDYAFDEEKERQSINMQMDMAIELAKKELNEAVELNALPKATYPTFAYRGNTPVWWSDNEYIPAYRYLSKLEDVSFVRTIRHDFIAVKKNIDTAVVITAIPLYDGYKIENRYFSSSFNQDIFDGHDIQILSPADGDKAICHNDHCLFSIEFKAAYQADTYQMQVWTVVFFSIGVLLCLIAIYLLAYSIGRKKFGYGTLILLGGFLVLRYITVELSWPSQLIDDPLFDSRDYASSALNASFADLLLNMLILGLVANYVFYLFPQSTVYRKILAMHGVLRYVIAGFFALVIALLLHWLHLYFQNIYHNSRISLDITESLDIDVIRLIALIGYVGFFYSIVLFIHVLIRTIRKLLKNSAVMLGVIVIGFMIAALILVWTDDIYWISTLIGLVILTLLVLSKLPRSFSRLSFSTFLYIFVYLICGALIAAFSIHVFEQERELDRKRKYANRFLIDNDQMAEYLLSELNEKISNDFYIQSTLASPFLSKSPIISKIRQVYLNDYFDRYDVKIYLYNPTGESIEGSVRSADSMLKLNVETYKTGYEGVYFINRQQEGVPKRYLDYIEIKRRGITAGYVVMDLRLKRIIPENVYPEMLVDNRFLSPFDKVNYSYAVFSNSQVMYSSGEFNYDKAFVDDSGVKDQNSFNYNNYSHLTLNDLSGHNLVISSPKRSLTGIVSDFSFFFIFKVFVLLALIIIYAFYVWIRKSELTYAARIQLYLNIAFFLPLLAVSITTLSLINSAFEYEVKEENYKKAEEVGNNLADALADYVNGYSNKDELNQLISDIATYSGADINVFDKSGKLISTNQWAIYDNDLISEYANYNAYDRIVNHNEQSLTTNESVGNLEYNAAYFGIKSFDTGDLIGFVSIPFFESEHALEESQIVVITNIINVFTFIFIIFLFISYFATKWLVFPLQIITQKIKKTTLTEFNEPLTWNADDEIGMLVGEYNKMLLKLEESKRALARSEKQSAWREIAKQVAHEIKNPLTPMKLTLQHLQRKLIDKENSTGQSQPIESLLSQIDTLSDIVSSFSSFAQMPIPESEKYELTQVIHQAVDVYGSHDKLDLRLHMPDHEVYTIGDAQLMGRIISNLILNAVQASEQTATVEIKMELDGDSIMLKFSDKGRGIPEDIRSKVFMPNFTTKDSGSGIGLAIAKHGVEHAGGEIWFETEEGSGTVFYIQLPMVYE